MPHKAILEKLKKYKILSDFLTPASFNQLIRYLITGFCSAAIEISLLYIFKVLLKLALIEANSIALTIVFWFNFLMNRLWSFKSKSSLRKQLLMYGVLFVINLGASDLIMYLLSTLLHLQYLIAKVFAIGAIVSWNFILYKKIIYK
jgi:putative flippase GtrA